MSKKKKKPLMAMVSSAYFKIYTKNFLTFRKGAIGKSRYACRKYPGYVSVFAPLDASSTRERVRSPIPQTRSTFCSAAYVPTSA